MWDALWERMLSANAFGVDRSGFSGFGESVVTGVEVFTLFEVVGFGGELAAKAEESLLVGERDCVLYSVRDHKSCEVQQMCWVTKLLTLILTLF